MKSTVIAGMLAGACLLAPAVASAAPKAGVVVDYRAASHTATVAGRSGTLTAVHTATAAHVGDVVRVRKLQRLANGTRAARLITTGTSTHARVRGMVVAATPDSIAIGAAGTTFVVRTGVSADTPAVGSTVTADVTINGEELDADEVTTGATPAAGTRGHVEGRVSAIDTTLRTITVVNTDDGVTSTFVVGVPDTTVDLATFTVGDEVEFHVTINADGTFTLAGGCRNRDRRQAGHDTEEHHHQRGPGDTPPPDAHQPQYGLDD
ncbi:MAG: hypothetical protein U0Y82_06460 [Thermoleophilia bacterium]